MKQIIKSTIEPKPLEDYRIESRGINHTWNSFQNPYKGLYKTFLLREQGYICAYCMQIIAENNMKIEHIKERHRCTEIEKLHHSNMIAVCKGKTDTFEHCDTKRGNLPVNQQTLTINPSSEHANCEEQTTFLDSNIISFPINFEITYDLNIKLNLNCEALKTKRNSSEEGYISGLNEKAEIEEFDWTIDKLEEELNRLLQIDTTFEERRFDEFCIIKINLIKDKIKNLQEES